MADDAETKAIHAAMEPASLPYAAFEVGALISIAISLKRLADVAEKATGAGLPSVIFHQVEDLAYRAGVAFKNGDGR